MYTTLSSKTVISMLEMIINLFINQLNMRELVQRHLQLLLEQS